LSGQSTPSEQNFHQLYSLIVASPAVRSSDIATVTTIASAAAKPDIITTDPVTLSVLSADIDDVVQRVFDTWKNETMPIDTQMNMNETLPFNNDDDFLLADILQRSENEQQAIFLRSIGNQVISHEQVVFRHFFPLDNQSNISSLFRSIPQNEPVPASG
jgi:hypothetical protein